ncbi:MAG: glutamine synthetase family protein [Pseudomonadota bacterium]
MAAIEFEDLKARVSSGEIDTVLACLVDMQGRLLGKRFHAQHFIDSGYKETHCCNYLLATDIEMNTVEGFKASSWSQGYGDYVMKPDLSTLRPLPWLEGTALVLCDVIDHNTHTDVDHSPRALLKKQVERARRLGFDPMMATELEFFLFKGRYEEIRQEGYRSLTPVSDYIEDYHILQTTKEEVVMRPLRNHLYAAGIPVECSKGEAAAGQEELNIRYAPALDCADFHAIAKHATKEIAWHAGYAASFLAKWRADEVGSASHIHQSLWRDGANAFWDADADYGMSQTMQHYLAGLIQYAPQFFYFLAPYINSYKRFVRNSFAPTTLTWSLDNRTAGFRICDANGANVRIECRLGGSDLNPHLALAAQLAAGLAGIEEKLELPAAIDGNHYADKRPALDKECAPNTLTEAIVNLREGRAARQAFGDAVIDHYVNAAMWEQEKYDSAVTDFELRLGFEQA